MTKPKTEPNTSENEEDNILPEIAQQRRRLMPRIIALLAGIVILTFGYALFPRTVSFAYSEDNCITNPTLMPRLHSVDSSEGYDLEMPSSFSIAGYPLFSAKTCVQATAPPQQNKSETPSIKFLGVPFFKKQVKTTAQAWPEVVAHHDDATQVSTKGKLDFALSEADVIFEYKLSSGEDEASCESHDGRLACHLEELELAQDETYELKLERHFEDNPVEAVLDKTIRTLEPIEVEETSIGEEGIIYDKPKSIKVVFNKPIGEVGEVKLHRLAEDEKQPVKFEAVASGTELVLNLSEELPREADFELQIDSLAAEDKSFLDEPFDLKFETSGGPKVEGISIGAYGVSTTPTVTITFDQPVAEENIGSLVFLARGDNKLSSSVTVQGSRVTIRSGETLPRCTGFSVQTAAELASEHGIKRGSAYKHNSRTICQVVSSIGRSVRGRSILSYRFGTGGSVVMFVGGMHGNEESSKYTLDSLIPYLERNAPNIPSNRTIIVVPNANPDGIATGSRLNARGVDLNRNFGTNNWRKNVIVPGIGTLPNGGGSAPFSEPETKALRDAILANRPRMLLTYHARASIIISNDSGDSRAQGQRYASSAGYRFATGAQACSIFSYCNSDNDFSGAMEDWMHEKHGLPALLVELATTYLNEFSRNRAAIWSMVRL